jgi:predicted short-subunit dehydrogenase-like oxidoreductase (DUF2520 family)
MTDALYIVGAGRVGTALSALLHRAGLPLAGIWSRSPEGARRATELSGIDCSHGPFPAQIARADTVILAVRDPVVPTVAGALLDAGLLRAAKVVLHCGGMQPAALALSPLSSVYALGTLHPLVAVVHPRQAVRLIPEGYCAVEGDERALQRAEELVEAMGARSFRLNRADMALYHAAAVLASNHAVALWDGALNLLSQTGLDRERGAMAMMTLLRSTLENVQKQGLPDALTGPVRRGDVETVKRHLTVLQERAPRLARLYRSCTAAAVTTAREAAHEETPSEALLAIEELVSKK